MKFLETLKYKYYVYIKNKCPICKYTLQFIANANTSPRIWENMYRRVDDKLYVKDYYCDNCKLSKYYEIKKLEFNGKFYTFDQIIKMSKMKAFR